MDYDLTIEVRHSDASGTVSEMLGALIGLAIDLETEDGYPSGEVYVLRVDGDGDLVVCEFAGGAPETHSTWAIPQTSIRKIVLPLGDAA